MGLNYKNAVQTEKESDGPGFNAKILIDNRLIVSGPLIISSLRENADNITNIKVKLVNQNSFREVIWRRIPDTRTCTSFLCETYLDVPNTVRIDRIIYLFRVRFRDREVFFLSGSFIIYSMLRRFP